MTPRSLPVRARTLAAAALLPLAAAGLASAQRVSQNLPFAGGYRGSIGADPPLDRTAPQRAEVAGRVYRALLRGEARRHLDQPPDAPAVFDARLAERLGEWSLRWMEAARNAGGRAARFEAARAHLERMRGWRAAGPCTTPWGRLAEPSIARGSATSSRWCGSTGSTPSRGCRTRDPGERRPSPAAPSDRKSCRV